MCIRDSLLPPYHRTGRRNAAGGGVRQPDGARPLAGLLRGCLLYTSDAADERSSVDLGGRRVLKKKKNTTTTHRRHLDNTKTKSETSHKREVR